MQINDREVVEKVKGLIEPIVRGLGFRLFDVEFKPERGWVLRIIIDKDGGVTIGDCEEVSKKVSALLDVEDVVPVSYLLEVSSPGLTRELTKPQHFDFFIGRLVRVVLREPVGGKRELRGYIDSVEQGVLRVKDEENLYHIPLSIVAKANLELERW